MKEEQKKSKQFKIKKGALNLCFALVVAILGAISYTWGNSSTALVATIFAIGSTISATLSLIFLHLESRSKQAQIATRALQENYSGRTELFDQNSDREKVAFSNFSGKIVPIFSFIWGVSLIATGYFLRKDILSEPSKVAENPLQITAIMILPFFIALLSGSYFSGLSRESGMRWFRSAGSWLLATATVFIFSTISLISESFFELKRDLDKDFTSILLIFIIIIGIEITVGVILDLYRPDLDAKEKPAYESKILSIIFQPGGVAKNIAEIINYQFGFTVSDSWFFQIMKKTVFPFILITATVTYFMTSIVYIDSDSQGIREFCGRVVSKEPLEPGVYVKAPYPFGEIRRFPVRKIQKFTIGYKADETHKTSDVVVWTRSHVNNEENFLLPDSRSGADNSDSIAVSFVTVRIPVRFVVKDLYSYLYNFRDAKEVLRKIAQTETVSYLANSDFFNFLSHRRLEASEELTKRIQREADKSGIGVEIVYVNLVSTHPPVEVGDAFQKVTSAMEKKEALILNSTAFRNRVIPEAKGKAFKIVKDAEGAKVKKVANAKADAARFKKQYMAYREFASFYLLSKELEVLEGTTGKRKYIVSPSFKNSNYIINLEDKLSPDLFDMDLSQPTEK